MPYSDNGAMKAIVIRNNGEVIDTLDVNEICGMDSLSKPIVGFMNPLVTACFNDENNIAIQAFHKMERKHYMFTYSWKDKEILTQPKSIDVTDCT